MAAHELLLGALVNITADTAAPFPVLRTLGSARVGLLFAAGEAITVSPGQFHVELRLRPLSGELAPRLHLAFVGGGGQNQAPDNVEQGVWRWRLSSHRAVSGLEVLLPNACEFAFVEARLLTEAEAVEAAPSLRGALVMGARAIFRKLPASLRRALLGSGRAAWLRRLRASEAPTPAVSGAARLATGGAAGAYAADFENRQAVARGMRAPAFDDAPIAAPVNSPANSGVKLVAFYLPQFHAIPENDAWWGKGFTEWTNLAKAAPQFVGHYQPRLPGELGFYDLRTPGVMKAQAELARAHGVSAFCFHYYWFAGKRLLEAPVEAFLADRSIDIEFCLCWANENWTRRWDGEEDAVLIAQNHTPEDHARVFDDIARHMEDPRYIRVGDKPLIVLYRPDVIDDVGALIAIWRESARARGWPGLFIAATNAFRFDMDVPPGFDALVEFPPHGLMPERIEERLAWLNPHHAGAVFDYAEVAQAEVRRMGEAGRADVFPGVMPGWDNEARRPGAGAVYHNASPAAYGAWLRAAVARAIRALPPVRRFAFINAWNEWGEGAHLEPDRAFGRAYLLETARALQDVSLK